MKKDLAQAEQEVLKARIKAEKAILKDLEEQYKGAITEINLHIAQLLGRQDANLPHVIHRVEYQRMLKQQVQSSLDKLHSQEYESVTQYLNESYTDAFVGTVYTLHHQDMPVILPISQALAVKAITLDTKLKKTMYEEMGKDINQLKKTIQQEITRGISSGMMYSEIAQNISRQAGIPMRRAKTIARTEGGRVQEQATFDAGQQAMEKGADLVKQWSAIRDGKTRDAHRMLHMQTREMNEPFEIDGEKAMHPHDFGDPALDCNCRCTLLTVARASLDADVLKQMQEDAHFHGLMVKDSKELGHAQAKNIAEFKKRYLKAAENPANTTKPLINQGKDAIINIDELTPCLRRLSDGKIINTTVIEVEPTKKAFKDWEFDWTVPAKNGYTVRAIKADGDDRIQGMVALKPDPQNYAVRVDIVEAAPFNNPHNKLFKQKEYAGVGGHLFAEAVKESYKQGYDGYVFFKAKTNLIEHYESTLGAVLINPKDRIMAIDERAARKLYEQYYQED